MRASPRSDCYRWQGSTLVLEARVQPRAGANELELVEGGRLRIRVTAAPVDNAANRKVIEMIAKVFGVPKSKVRLLAGAGARDKRFAIEEPRRLPEWVTKPV